METLENSKKKISIIWSFLLLTFLFMLLGWGVCAILSQTLTWDVQHPLLYTLFILGGFSPTIASFISLKIDGRVNNFWNWIKQIFDFKHNWIVYLFVILFATIYFLIGCLINGFEIGAPFFALLWIIPLMLFTGGNEEVGWRMILQPELEKKIGFHFAVIITGIVWWIWHTPLFFINGTANASMNYFLFGINCIGLSYALGSIRKLSNGVFPCILLHCLINGISGTLVFHFSILSSCILLAVMLLISIILFDIIPMIRSKYYDKK